LRLNRFIISPLLGRLPKGDAVSAPHPYR